MSRLARAAMAGLLGGLLLASAALAITAARRLGVDCVGLSANECALERETASDEARREGLMAIGALALGGGVYLRWRRPANGGGTP